MEQREKIKQIYKKHSIRIGEDYLEGIMNNPQRVDGLMRTYKNEEIDSMNEIFGKDYSNLYFTQEGLEFVSKMDLFDQYTIKVAKEIWNVKDNTQLLKVYLKILENESVEKGKKLLKSLQEKEVIAKASNH